MKKTLLTIALCSSLPALAQSTIFFDNHAGSAAPVVENLYTKAGYSLKALDYKQSGLFVGASSMEKAADEGRTLLVIAIHLTAYACLVGKDNYIYLAGSSQVNVQDSTNPSVAQWREKISVAHQGAMSDTVNALKASENDFKKTCSDLQSKYKFDENPKSHKKAKNSSQK